MSLPTIRRLDEAMREILGAHSFDALRASSGFCRPHVHRDAMAEAFLQRREDEHANVLRDLYVVLQGGGFYPAECWREGDDA